MKKLVLTALALTLFSVLGFSQTQQTPPSTTNQLGDTVNIVQGPTIRNLAPTSAELSWKTDKVAATDVRFGLTQDKPDQRKFEPGGSRDHSVTLSGLQPGKTYFFYIYDRKGQVRNGGSFTTPTQ